MEASSEFIPYSQRELVLIRRAAVLRGGAAEPGLRGEINKKRKGGEKSEKPQATSPQDCSAGPRRAKESFWVKQRAP